MHFYSLELVFRIKECLPSDSQIATNSNKKILCTYGKYFLSVFATKFFVNYLQIWYKASPGFM